MNWPRSYRMRNANTSLRPGFHFVPLTPPAHGRFGADRLCLSEAIPNMGFHVARRIPTHQQPSGSVRFARFPSALFIGSQRGTRQWRSQYSQIPHSSRNRYGVSGGVW
jgi:hypothetical protein